MALLFLDFDGVLHRMNRVNGPFEFVDDFERVMRAYRAVDIVISSSWRDARSIEELRCFFSDDIAGRIIDVTPQLSGPDHQYSREAEIRAWMRTAGREDEFWVALDDCEEFFSPGCPELILVDPNVGFNEATEAELCRRLEGTA